MNTLTNTIRAALELQPRSDVERRMPSGGWNHWWERAVAAGLLTADEARRSSLPTASLERLEARRDP